MGMFSQNLPVSAAFTGILKLMLPQYNAVRVCSLLGQVLSFMFFIVYAEAKDDTRLVTTV